jgi:hypothetical protein
MNGQGSSSEIRTEGNAGEISVELLSKDFTKKQSISNGSEREITQKQQKFAIFSSLSHSGGNLI